MIAGITNYGANGPEIRWHICWFSRTHRLSRSSRSENGQSWNSVVVVVSAMGKTTDQLVKLAHQISKSQSPGDGFSTGEQVSIAR